MINRSRNNMTYDLRTLAEKVDGSVLGDAATKIDGISGLQDARPGHITFLANPRYRAFISKTQASALIASGEEPLFKGPVLQVSDPYLAFAMLLDLFFPPVESTPGIHPSAVIYPGSDIGEGVSIDACAVIQKGVRLGKGVGIGACAFVGENSRIDDASSIAPNVTIYPDTEIGQRVIIHAGSVIGSDGFGYARKDGLPYKVPQVGRVVIEDDCEIGANVSIDRAALGETRIGRGTKIDNLVQIGHNVVIGPYSIVVSQVAIGGSAHIGKGVVLAGQVGVAGHIRIGDGVTVAAKSGITKSVPPGQTMAGHMAIPLREWRRSEAIYRHLPDLQEGCRDLLKRVKALEKMLESKD